MVAERNGCYFSRFLKFEQASSDWDTPTVAAFPQQQARAGPAGVLVWGQENTALPAAIIPGIRVKRNSEANDAAGTLSPAGRNI